MFTGAEYCANSVNQRTPRPFLKSTNFTCAWKTCIMLYPGRSGMLSPGFQVCEASNSVIRETLPALISDMAANSLTG